MVRLILIILCLLFSLLTLFPTPSHYTWYFSIMAAEFPWIFQLLLILLFIVSAYTRRFRPVALLLSTAAFMIFMVPTVAAYETSKQLDTRLDDAFGPASRQCCDAGDQTPFSFWHMIMAKKAKEIRHATYEYSNAGNAHLKMDIYAAQQPGIRPCVLVVHGGSWKKGKRNELDNVDEAIANAGYQVAAIDYRMAPQFLSPRPVNDVRAALKYLHAHAVELQIDSNNFVLLGRSAGGQIVLTAAYSIQGQGIRGVAGFYGPTDMIRAYYNPDNPLVMDSKKVMSDFFGGTPAEVRQQYVDGSPDHYVTRTTVPTLLVHGRLDAHVHIEESMMLASVLKANEVPHMLLALPCGTHGCEYNLNSPSGQLAFYALKRFLYAVTNSRPANLQMVRAAPLGLGTGSEKS